MEPPHVPWQSKSVKCLHAYLKERYVKAGLVELCLAASELGLEIDPDNDLTEDREEIIKDKLRTETGELCIPTLLSDYSASIGMLPTIGIFDIYNYLINFSEYSQATFPRCPQDGRIYHGQGWLCEGYFMFSISISSP